MFLGEKGPGDLSTGWPRCCALSRCEGTQVPLGVQSVGSCFPEHKEIPAELDLQCPDAMDAVPGCTQPAASPVPLPPPLGFHLGLAQLSAAFLPFLGGSEVQKARIALFALFSVLRKSAVASLVFPR